MMADTPDLMDFYEDDNYPDVITETYGWPPRNIGSAGSIVTRIKPGHTWRNVAASAVPKLINEAMSSLSDQDQILKFTVELNKIQKTLNLHYDGPGFTVIPLHGAGAPNLQFALEYYMGKRNNLVLMASKDGVFWLHQ